MNMIDWLRATGEWMHKDRPDLYPSAQNATATLSRWVESLRAIGPNSIETGGHALIFNIEDGVEEWTLQKKIATCEIFYAEEAAMAFGWDREVSLPYIADVLDVDFGLDNDQ